MNALIRARLGLALCTGLVAALPVPAETGSEGMDRIIAQALGGMLVPSSEPLASRVRYMACGYVAPDLSRRDEAPESADAAFAQMLDWLRTQLRRFAD